MLTNNHNQETTHPTETTNPTPAINNCMVDYEVSFRKSIVEPVFKELPLSSVIDKIRSEQYKCQIESLRKIKNDADYRIAKGKLPVIYPSCVFSGNSASGKNIKSYNCVVQLDYDKIFDERQLETFKDLIKNEAYTQACFVSPSGKGLKVFVGVETSISVHTEAFNAVREYYDNKLSYESDIAVKNVNRGCYVSYDPEAYINCDAVVFKFTNNRDINDLENIWNYTVNKWSFVEGQRHNYMLEFVSSANHQGIPKESTLSFALGKERDGFSAREITRIVEDVYSRYVDQFNKYQVSFLSDVSDLSVPAKETTIPDEFLSVLPESIKNPVMLYEGRERDYFTLSLLPLLGAILENNVWGRYNKSISHCNLYTLIVAPPASGKGVMNDAKHLFSAIEKQRRDMYKTFTIPGNISSAMLIQMMSANEGSGILCETEADTITNALKQDWGGFSDILRKGFHYEEVSYARKGEEEKIKLNKTNLSALITCTPGQVPKLMKEQCDGLYSRFLFYYSDEVTDFDLEIPNYNEDIIEKRLSNYKTAYRNIYEYFEQHPLEIRMEPELWKYLITHFKNKQSELRENGNTTTEDVVKRAGLICFRITMLLMAVDCYDNNVKEDSVFVKKEFLEASILLIDYLLNHNTKVLGLVPHTNQTLSKPFDKYSILDQVNEEFTTAEFCKATGLEEKTAQRRLKSFLDDGRVMLIKKGKYKKT